MSCRVQEKEVRHSHEQRSLASVVFRVPWEGVTSIRPSCQIRVRVGVDVAIRKKESVSVSKGAARSQGRK